MPKVIVVGSFNFDHVWSSDELPAPGATRLGRYSGGPGGKGFNQAVASARAGAATRLVVALGEDAAAAYARALAAAEDIDLRDAVVPEQPSGTAGIFVDAAARNVIVVAPGANDRLDADFVAAQCTDLQAGDVLLAQLETPAVAVLAAMHAARAAGARVMLNPAPANAPTTPELLAAADVLTPNETEFAALLARHHATRIDAHALAARRDADLHALCRQACAGSCVLTLGAEGAFVSHAPGRLLGDTQPFYRVAACAVQAVDTTGAGDAFSGALAASLAQRPALAFADHVRFANRYAGQSTEHRGAALAMPTLADVQARFGAT